nr:hypothetical protein [Tanacetum cinerariifolium]
MEQHDCGQYDLIDQQCVVYQNFLREFWSTAVAFDPFPSTDELDKRPLKEFLFKFSVSNGQRSLTLDFQIFGSSTSLDYNNGKYVEHPTPEIVLDGNYSSTKQINSIQQLLAYSLITGTKVDIGEIIYSDLVTKLLNKSRLKYDSYLSFISCTLHVLLGPDYTQDKKFGFLPPILSNSNFRKDSSKVTEIELMAHMIVVNNWRDSVSPPSLDSKPKKGKSQIMTSTSPKSQGPKASGALSKKSKRPMSKQPPTKTKITPPTPTEDSEQSYSVSSGTGTATHPKDLGGNKQPLDRDITFMYPDEDMAKTTPHPEGFSSYEGEPDTQPMILSYAYVRAILLSEDEAQESKEDILGAGDEMDDNPQFDETQHQSPPPQGDKPTSSIAPHPEASDTDSLSDSILKKYEDQRKLVKASSIIHPDPDEPVRVEFLIKKAMEEARLNAISKTEVIKVVRKEEKMIGIHLKEAISSKAGELFRKAQDAEHEVLKRQHNEKEIILKKKNTMVKDLMNSLSQRYERLRQIPGEHGIQSALPAPEQAASQTSRRKQKHMKLSLKMSELSLKMSINAIEFSMKMSHSWSDIDKVGMKALGSYLVATSMVKSPKNARFSIKLRKLIAEHPDQEKHKSKKVKLEAIGYKID